ncbi:MAG TPA: 16S rRNA pseudouridine(516) synthase [Sulfuricurvum kujiense]|uniref:Pseudouridine synthase n=1 Tax=Sulfuricurvum kujiense TaxID=148813 RepID=A0A2D3WLI7_9BACT|nr:16S rRNA pseudouridine(516) synthase [Sulfuricurvum kujiense]DAB37969.1 MAG TPA: 16S rRNA pseudouridine(516) synthase [Sulfuricurvum kujiense]
MKNSKPSKVRLDKLLGSLGYCVRKEVAVLLRDGVITHIDNLSLKSDTKVSHEEILYEGEPLDPPTGIVILMNKPLGLVCSHDDGEGRLVYDLLPPRWRMRDPKISTIGRLDKETSGLLLLSDDGALLHRLTSPKHKVPKVYEATLDRPLQGDEAEIFASGTLMLNGEKNPCLPAKLTIIDESHVTLEITEGRYHQVRRMFAAVGNHVMALHRSSFGDLTLGDLKEGEYRLLDLEEMTN